MTLIDSVDSIVMLYSYSNFAERSFVIFDRRAGLLATEKPQVPPDTNCAPERHASAAFQQHDSKQEAVTDFTIEELPVMPGSNADVEKAIAHEISVEAIVVNEKTVRDLRLKRNTMSGLSIILTFMSILVAFT